MNQFQELKYQGLSFSGKKEHTVDLRRGMDEKANKSVSGKYPRTSKMRSIIILLVLGGVFNLIFIEFSNCSYLQG